MPRRPKGSGKDSASKNTFNPTGGPTDGDAEQPGSGSKQSRGQTGGQFEQDPKRRIGQFGGAGEPPLIKK